MGAIFQNEWGLSFINEPGAGHGGGGGTAPVKETENADAGACWENMEASDWQAARNYHFEGKIALRVQYCSGKGMSACFEAINILVAEYTEQLSIVRSSHISGAQKPAIGISGRGRGMVNIVCPQKTRRVISKNQLIVFPKLHFSCLSRKGTLTL